MCITMLHLRLDSLAGAKIIYWYSELVFPFMLFWCLEINTPVPMWFDWYSRGCGIQILLTQLRFFQTHKKK